MKYRLEADDHPQQPKEAPEAKSDARVDLLRLDDQIGPALEDNPERDPSTGYQIPRQYYLKEGNRN